MSINDHWQRGSVYEGFVGRWSRRVAPEFLSWLGVPPGRRWLDLGCGTGALAGAILDRCAPSSVVGVDPSEGLLETARESLGDRAELHRGSASDIPLPDAAVDVVVSGLVLNFVPDLPAALTETARVTNEGGVVAAYVWDYAGGMQLLRYFWDAVVDIDPDAAGLDEGIRFPLCRPDALLEQFSNAGLAAIEVRAIDILTPFSSFDDYWLPFPGGQGPGPAYVAALGEPARVRVRDALRERLPVQADGSIPLTARAWAVRGTANAASTGRIAHP